jgi:uncharacterized protein
MNEILKRNLSLPLDNSETFFLWGPRQTGKSTLLKEHYPDVYWVDLLKPEEFRRYMERPEILREEVRLKGITFAVIDEIQKVPELLDEVHWLHENESVNFALCGSSARKVKRGHANLLGGRAIRYELFGFSLSECQDEITLLELLNRGYLPRIASTTNYKRLQNSYISTYLKEEIAEEGLVRRLPIFSEFLSMAALSDTETTNFSTIARDTGVSSETIKSYYEILCDTMVGRFLPSYRRRPKRRVVSSHKFYFSDVGIVNHLAKRGQIENGSELYGKAFENWVFHELNAYNTYKERFADFFYWQLSSGIEVDFIVNHIDLAIEVKSSKSIKSAHLKGLRQLLVDHPETKRCIVVSGESKSRMTEDKIEILSIKDFINQLWDGSLF